MYYIIRAISYRSMRMLSLSFSAYVRLFVRLMSLSFSIVVLCRIGGGRRVASGSENGGDEEAALAAGEGVAENQHGVK